MFTGLIQAVGSIQEIQERDGGKAFSVSCPELCKQLELGASIAIDGACTTVIHFDAEHFLIEASPETLRRTIMGQYQPDKQVNLELPLTLHQPLGGHFVTGHVDCVAQVTQVQQEGLSWLYEIEVPSDDWANLLIEKGSVCLNGISLTVNYVNARRFGVAIIPHTMQMTTMGQLSVGQSVNIETDMLGKYVQRFMQAQQEKTQTSV